MTLLIALGLCPLGAAQGLSDELTELTTLEGNEVELVNAAHRVHKQQIALIKWDQDLIAGYTKDKEADLVQIKNEDIQRRIRLIDEAWRFVLQRYPNNAKAGNYYGELLYDYMGRQGDAVRYWLLAVNLDPKFGPAHNNLGIHYMHIGVYDSGLEHLGQAVKLEPKNPDFLFNLAQMYLTYFPELERKFKMSKQKLYKEAMRLSKDAATYAPGDFAILQDYATNFYAGQNFDVEVNWSEAAAAWRKAREFAPKPDDRYFTLINEGRVWMRANQPANAIAPLEEALAIHPDSDVTKELLEKARAGKTPAPQS